MHKGQPQVCVFAYKNSTSPQYLLSFHLTFPKSWYPDLPPRMGTSRVQLISILRSQKSIFKIHAGSRLLYIRITLVLGLCHSCYDANSIVQKGWPVKTGSTVGFYSHIYRNLSQNFFFYGLIVPHRHLFAMNLIH